MIYLFNPENDLALATNIARYTPPAAAMRLHSQGALLPLWYAGSGDRVVAHGVNARWYDSRVEAFGPLPKLHDHQPCQIEAAPWGWSRAARQILIDEGLDARLLPDDASLDAIRTLSHRRTASRLMQLLAQELPHIPFPQAAKEVKDPASVEALTVKWGGAYIKHPYSGSGRGVMFARKATPAALRFAEAGIRAQGSVMIEPALDLAMDFARLYKCLDGEAEDLGTSVFTTDAAGHYIGNLLAPESERLARVCEFYPAEQLLEVAETLRKIIAREIAPYYNGVLGVDMLVSTSGLLHPCVEINLRHTMGYVANRFTSLYLHPEARGEFRVVPFRTCSEIPVENFTTDCGRLLEGCLHLCPAPTSGFALIVEAQRNN